jgi:hypothetical protein
MKHTNIKIKLFKIVKERRKFIEEFSKGIIYEINFEEDFDEKGNSHFHIVIMNEILLLTFQQH